MYSKPFNRPSSISNNFNRPLPTPYLTAPTNSKSNSTSFKDILKLEIEKKGVHIK